MRIALSRYESAKRKIAEYRAESLSYEKTMRTWDDAIKQLGNVGHLKVVAVIIDDDDGSVKGEFEVPNIKVAEQKGA